MTLEAPTANCAAKSASSQPDKTRNRAVCESGFHKRKPAGTFGIDARNSTLQTAQPRGTSCLLGTNCRAEISLSGAASSHSSGKHQLEVALGAFRSTLAQRPSACISHPGKANNG